MTGHSRASEAPAVAVVGMSVLLPGAPDLDTYWRNITSGTDAITDVPPNRWNPWFYEPETAGSGRTPVDRVYCRRGGFADEYATVAATRFGIPPVAVAGTEPDQLIALGVAAAAIEDAGGEARLPDRDRIAVVLGRGGYVTPAAIRFSERVRGVNQLTHTLREILPELDPAALDKVRLAYHDALGPYAPENAIGLVSNLAASRLANRLDLRGPAYTVDGACASSLIAVDQAVSLLESGRCDAVLAGGVHHCHDISFWSVFAQMRALSPSQEIRPFDRNADGTLIGEGTAVLLLKRLADALHAGDRVYAVIRGTGVAGDGRTGSLMSPDSAGQVRAVRQAWGAAGTDPAAPGSVGLVEAHGTATPAGDAAEIATMAEVFGPGAKGAPRAAIGTVKSMIGHTMPTAGAAGLVKAVLAVHHGVLPPTLHCDDPHPALAATRFAPLREAAPWESGPGTGPRRAGVNAFGFGGINAHVVVEQFGARTVTSVPTATRGAGSGVPGATARAAAVGPVRVREAEGTDLLRLAADSVSALARLLDADDATVRRAAHADHDVDAGSVRLVVADPDARRLTLARRVVTAGKPWRGRGEMWFVPRPLLGPSGGGRVAFVFPGLDADFRPRVDDLAAWLGTAAPATGTGTAVDHGLSVLAVGSLLDRALRAAGVWPDAIAGCSVGEWNAMLSAGALTAEAEHLFGSVDTESVAVPDLVFAAVGLPAAAVLEGIDTRCGIVVSHDNAPARCVVCGPVAQVRRAVEDFRRRGVFARELPFRSGFHTPMFARYAEPFRRFAEILEPGEPSVDLWSGTTAARFDGRGPAVRELFLRMLVEPVRQRELIEALYAAGHRAFVQVGLGGLPEAVDETLGDRPHLAVPAATAHRDGMSQLRRTAAALWADGYPAVIPGAADRPHAGTVVATVVGTSAGTVEEVDVPRTGPAARPPGPQVPLDLGSALVSFAPEDRQALRRAFGEAAGTGAAPGIARVNAAGNSFPAAEASALPGPVGVELRALMEELTQTTDLAATALVHTAGRQPTAPARPAADPTVVRPEKSAPPTYRTVLKVSTDTMPHLRDHCFFRQREGWPDESDRRPVMPGTTIVRHMAEIAEAAAPGRRTVELRELRLLRWLAAAPPVDVAVTAVAEPPGTPDRLRMDFGGYSTALAVTAADYPARPDPWEWDPSVESAPPDSAEEMYEGRLMFHGPAFQGVTELTAMGPRHIRGVITVPSAPGALLDCAGQILGYWIIRSFTTRTRVLPVGLDSIRFHGPHPVPGARIGCHARITRLDESTLQADIQLTEGGQVWAELSGWSNRRFDNHPETQAVENFPEYRALSHPRPEGWVLLFERWADLASRDLVLRNHLNAAERAEYEACPPPRRRHWLLGRIAAKDAVRTRLWAGGEETVFPAEIRVGNAADGRPWVAGVHGRELRPGLDVSIAHCAQAAVALVRPQGDTGVGIDIEEVTERPAAVVAASLTAGERDLMAAGRDRTREPETVWFTRFWAAKEAVAKAEGTGLEGRPRRFVVEETADGDLVVSVRPDASAGDTAGGGMRTYRVGTESVSAPPDLEPREYVVAWTK